MAFTDYETEQLRKALLKETRHCAVTLGMKKTSVDQLHRRKVHITQGGHNICKTVPDSKLRCRA